MSQNQVFPGKPIALEESLDPHHHQQLVSDNKFNCQYFVILCVAIAKYSLEEFTQVKESKTHSPGEKKVISIIDVCIARLIILV